MLVICIFRVETHKNDVLQFCQSTSAACRDNPVIYDSDSAELLWRFLELLIKQNGVSCKRFLSVYVMSDHYYICSTYA